MGTDPRDGDHRRRVAHRGPTRRRRAGMTAWRGRRLRREPFHMTHGAAMRTRRLAIVALTGVAVTGVALTSACVGAEHAATSDRRTAAVAPPTDSLDAPPPPALFGCLRGGGGAASDSPASADGRARTTEDAT